MVKIVPQTVLSRDGVEESTLAEIAEACHISADQIDDIYACTPLQISAMAESTIRTGASVFQYVFSFAPSVDVERVCIALQTVVSLNAILRTRLVDSRLGIVQIVTKGAHYTHRLPDNVQIEQYKGDEKNKALVLGKPLFHSAIIDRMWVLTMHHAIMDHSSLTFLFRDLLGIYHGHAPETRTPFKKFAEYCLNINETAAKHFWSSRFKGAPAIFPKVEPGYAPNATQKMTLKITSTRIGAGVSHAHVPSFIEAAWALTAGAYTNSESVAFGQVLSGRTLDLAGLETTLGPMIAIVPVQINLLRNMTVEGILKDRITALRQLQTHSALQYGVTRIRAVSDEARIASSFQTLLNIRPSLDDPDESEDLKYEGMDEPNGAFGLCLYCNLQEDGIFVEAISDPTILCKRQLLRVVHQFEHTFQLLLDADPQTKLVQLPLLNPHDRSEILKWNKKLPETVERCIHELFSIRAREQPEAVAIEAWDGDLSYLELDEMSDRLAHELRRKGVSPQDTVAFIFEKSHWTIVAIFAIMKAGGACVPIDPANPYARKAAIISSAHIKIILVSSAQLASSADLAPDIFVVNTASISGLADVTGSLDETCSPGDLAYIMFTSGSTGSPKGVMLEHRCLVSSLSSLAQKCMWQPGSRMLQFAAHVWDISMGEIFGALLFGGCLCIPSDEARESSLAKFITFSRVNWAWFTPTVLRTLSPEELPSLQSMISAGEPIGADSRDWGPCEASVLSSVAELTPESRDPESIGKPVSCAMWIVKYSGNTNELVPIGAIGEILVEGPGVARGYLDDSVRTAASFISPPAWAPSRTKAKHFYRTGDLAKYHSDGSIVFVGRQDSQVKIRGQRFELGELENVIDSCGEVQDVFTATRILKGRTELVAVVVLADPLLSSRVVLKDISYEFAEITSRYLRAIGNHVRARLPSYMVPTIWLTVEQMPRAASGKLDRVAISSWLKAKDLSSVGSAVDSQMAATLTPPSTAEERLLESVWSSVLDLPKGHIGRESSFMQLGGDSILAMQVASRCRKHGIQTTTSELLKGKSLAAVAELSLLKEPASDGIIMSYNAVPEDNHQVEPTAPIPSVFDWLLSKLGHSNSFLRRGNIERIITATDAQAYMLAAGELGEKGFHIQFKLELRPSLDSARLRRACEQVIRHHSILRTVFLQHGPALHQAILKGLPSETVVELEEEDNMSPKVTFREGNNLPRFRLFSDGQLCHRLCLDIHHSLYDALSLELVFRDLDAAYTEKQLSGGLYFHSWISHVESLDKSTPREYWRTVLRDSSMSYLVQPSARTIQIHSFDQQLKIRVPLQNLQTELGTPSSVMKAAWALLLSHALGTRDITFGEVSTNRYLPVLGLSEVRGPCLNFLPVRACLDHSLTFASLITQLQNQSAAGLPHHHLGFRSIIKDCTEWPSWSRFSSVLVYQNHGSLKPSLRIGDADCALSHSGEIGDTADISVIATPGSKDLEIDLHYSSRALPSKQIQWISRSLVTILERIPSFVRQRMNEVEDSIQNSLGSYDVPLSRTAQLPDHAKGHVHPPSLQAQSVVLDAWKELELLPRDQNEDCSLFSCGADFVTALLLSKRYLYCGYDISPKDIIQYPTRSMQAYMVDSKIKSKPSEIVLVD
ncbi:Nonribosomal peptide synthetase [Lachnellula hyalina]|uniref:Nonribosomal peptide synthetase n=1 Tax=Lachnellula hyalina TaxID=1316788 RepID=A0A8H8U0W1_9HELO|nr:Nonribosomal peptide synthetase [Lachnellula hyalina]TVY27745.1 Nonribosomal peptide synthetase [Lachnellula hyalina]